MKNTRLLQRQQLFFAFVIILVVQSMMMTAAAAAAATAATSETDPLLSKRSSSSSSAPSPSQQQQQQQSLLSTTTSSSISEDYPTTKDEDQRRQQPLLLPSLNIFVLCEPNPITYMSGQSVRFQQLLKHFAENYINISPSSSSSVGDGDGGDNVQLITTENPKKLLLKNPLPTSSCFNDKIPIHYVSGFQLPQYKTLTVSTGIFTFPKLWNLYNSSSKKPDIIHVSSPGFLLFPAILLCQLKGVPLLMSYHTHLPVYCRTYIKLKPFSIFLEWLVWKTIQFLHGCFANLTVVTSRQIANEFAEHGIKNVKIWPKGVDTHTFSPQYYDEDMRRRMTDGHPDDHLLVYIGRLAKEKRVSDLKYIMEKLLLSNKGHNNTNNTNKVIRLCIIGEGPEENALKAQFENTPNTIFLGRLEGLSLSQAFASGDVFVMPSDSETLGFVVMESMSSGVPCVACNAGGLRDLIDDGKTGYLVDVGDTDTYVNRIESLLLSTITTGKNNNATTTTTTTTRNHIVMNARKAAEQWSWYASMEFLRREAYIQAIHNFQLKRRKKSTKKKKENEDLMTMKDGVI